MENSGDQSPPPFMQKELKKELSITLGITLIIVFVILVIQKLGSDQRAAMMPPSSAALSSSAVYCCDKINTSQCRAFTDANTQCAVGSYATTTPGCLQNGTSFCPPNVPSSVSSGGSSTASVASTASIGSSAMYCCDKINTSQCRAFTDANTQCAVGSYATTTPGCLQNSVSFCPPMTMSSSH